MKFRSIVSWWIIAFLSIAAYSADSANQAAKEIVIPQKVHTYWGDDLIDREVTCIIHNALKEQLALKGYQVILKSRREIFERGPENSYVLEAKHVGGGYSANKQSITVELILFKLLNKNHNHEQEHYSDYDVDFKGILSQWKTKIFFEIALNISGKNEQKLKENIPKKIAKALKKHFAID